MELPIRTLLAVVVLAVTIAMGYNALDAHLTVQEGVAAEKAMSSLLVKAQMAGMGAPGSREHLTLVLKGHSRLALWNENFSGDVRGVARIDRSDGGNLLKGLPLPVWDSSPDPIAPEDFLEKEIIYLAGAYGVTMAHLSVKVVGGELDYLRIE